MFLPSLKKVWKHSRPLQFSVNTHHGKQRVLRVRIGANTMVLAPDLTIIVIRIA